MHEADNPIDDQRLIKWLKDYCLQKEARLNTSEFELNFEAALAIDHLVQDEPDQFMRMLQLICNQDYSVEDLMYFAAGPLEDYLSYHGETKWEVIVAWVRQNRVARTLIAGVWQGGMSNVLWNRLVKMREDLGVEPM